MLSPQDGEDFYDAIEWAGAQEWSNGNVGLLGVSYLAISQWVAATANPPSLKAIAPWEGQTDSFREVLYHGGVPETAFIEFWLNRVNSLANTPPLPARLSDDHPSADHAGGAACRRSASARPGHGPGVCDMVRPRLAHSWFVRGLQADPVRAEVDVQPRASEVGRFLQRRGDRGSAAVLRPFPQGRGQRDGRAPVDPPRGARDPRRVPGAV